MTEVLALLGGSPAIANKEHRLWPIVTDDERAGVMRVLDRGVLSGSFAPKATALEEEFARFCGAKFALLTHCGTSALQLALIAAGVEPGHEVIVPACSFVATPLSVALVGAIPIFADIDLATGCLDVGAAARAVTSRTRAIMPVHMHGGAADLDGFLALAEEKSLALVEDAAQAHGAAHRGRLVGAIGSAGGFSLQSSKNLSAGEGGIFVTNDEALADTANRVRNFGQDVPLAGSAGFDAARPLDGSRALDSMRMGSMYRGNEMMAAFARAQLARLPERTAQCVANAERLSCALAKLPGVTPPPVLAERTSVYHKYRVHIDPRQADVPLAPRALRDLVIRALRAEGLEVVLWQTKPLPAQAVFEAHRVSWSSNAGTDIVRNYDPACFPATAQLLDGSLVLFSQSCPLIAQSSEMVDRYAEAFARVWSQRHALVAWACAGSTPSAAP
jgi:perosamine synthetase